MAADREALQFFHGLAGYNFTQTYRQDLLRWAGIYTREFITLAYQLAPTLPGGKGFYVFADLLNRDPRKPWPVALQQRYNADLRQTQADPEAEPELGALLACDSGTGRVVEVDRETHRVMLQIGADLTECISVPWSATRPAQNIRWAG